MKSPEGQLASFLAKYTPEIATLGESILVEMRRRFPEALELVYDNYNALAVGFSPTEKAGDAIFSIALYPKWVSLFFLQSKGLPDPDGLLQGSGTVAKHIRLPFLKSLDDPAVRDLMAEALSRARVPLDSGTSHRVIIKSISERQRPRRPA